MRVSAVMPLVPPAAPAVIVDKLVERKCPTKFSFDLLRFAYCCCCCYWVPVDVDGVVTTSLLTLLVFLWISKLPPPCYCELLLEPWEELATIIISLRDNCFMSS